MTFTPPNQQIFSESIFAGFFKYTKISRSFCISSQTPQLGTNTLKTKDSNPGL